MTLEEACARVDELTRTMGQMAEKLANANDAEAAFFEAVLLGLWRERAALIAEVERIGARC